MPRATTSRFNERIRGVASVTLASAVGLSIALSIATPGRTAPSAADFEQAKALVLEGRRLRDTEKKPAEALIRFAAAHKLAGTTITGLDLARTLEQLGRLVDAVSAYDEIGRIPERPTDSQVAKDARVEAARKVVELRPRIAHLSFQVTGATSEVATTITLDGLVLPPEALLIARAVDPGPHLVVLKVPGAEDQTAAISLADGETRAVKLVVAPRMSPTVAASVEAPKPVESAIVPASIASAPPVASASSAPTSSASPPVSHVVDRGSDQRTAGVIVGAAGLVGLGVGGLIGLSARSDARGANCDANNVCATANDVTTRASAVSKANTATVIVGLGGAVALAGIVIWISAPSGEESATKTGLTTISLAPGGVTFGGAF
jgi:hypothetical protein